MCSTHRPRLRRPLNVVSFLNAFLGTVYVHPYSWDVSLPAVPTESPAFQDTYGRTSYYVFETEDLPLFGPLRTLGVPKSLIDMVEPFFRQIVELGYDRSIKPWVPTPARLIPLHDPVTVAADLLDAIAEGINNAAALLCSPPPSSPRTQSEAATTTYNGLDPDQRPLDLTHEPTLTASPTLTRDESLDAKDQSKETLKVEPAEAQDEAEAQGALRARRKSLKAPAAQGR